MKGEGIFFTSSHFFWEVNQPSYYTMNRSMIHLLNGETARLPRFLALGTIDLNVGRVKIGETNWVV